MPATLQLDPNRLRMWRLQFAYSQEALAEAAGLHPTTIARMESGAPASVTSIRKVATALGITVPAIAEVVND